MRWSCTSQRRRTKLFDSWAWNSTMHSNNYQLTHEPGIQLCIQTTTSWTQRKTISVGNGGKWLLCIWCGFVWNWSRWYGQGWPRWLLGHPNNCLQTIGAGCWRSVAADEKPGWTDRRHGVQGFVAWRSMGVEISWATLELGCQSVG